MSSMSLTIVAIWSDDRVIRPMASVAFIITVSLSLAMAAAEVAEVATSSARRALLPTVAASCSMDAAVSSMVAA